MLREADQLHHIIGVKPGRGTVRNKPDSHCATVLNQDWFPIFRELVRHEEILAGISTEALRQPGTDSLSGSWICYVVQRAIPP